MPPGLTHFNGLAIRSFAIAGGVAGAHTVTGVGVQDLLLAVWRLDRDATAANINISDLTSEFVRRPTVANQINNTGGTNTTGDTLLGLYLDLDQPDI